MYVGVRTCVHVCMSSVGCACMCVCTYVYICMCVCVRVVVYFHVITHNYSTYVTSVYLPLLKHIAMVIIAMVTIAIEPVVTIQPHPYTGECNRHDQNRLQGGSMYVGSERNWITKGNKGPIRRLTGELSLCGVIRPTNADGKHVPMDSN